MGHFWPSLIAGAVGGNAPQRASCTPAAGSARAPLPGATPRARTPTGHGTSTSASGRFRPISGASLRSSRSAPAPRWRQGCRRWGSSTRAVHRRSSADRTDRRPTADPQRRRRSRAARDRGRRRASGSGRVVRHGLPDHAEAADERDQQSVHERERDGHHPIGRGGGEGKASAREERQYEDRHRRHREPEARRRRTWQTAPDHEFEHAGNRQNRDQQFEPVLTRDVLDPVHASNVLAVARVPPPTKVGVEISGW